MTELIREVVHFLEGFSPIVRILIGVVGPLVSAVVLGGLIKMLMLGGTSWFKRALPAQAAQTAFEGGFFKQATTPGKPVSANAEPLILAVAGFFVFLAIGSLFLREIPGPRAQVKEEPKAAGPALMVKGNIAEFLGTLPAGNADAGKQLFTTKACVGCHSLEKGKRLVGPTFYGLQTVAGTRKSGQPAREYIYESIVAPNEYVVDGYQSGQMPLSFSQQLSPQEMANILAWIERDNAQSDP
jgi:mono/diheme cytochrome c family protein